MTKDKHIITLKEQEYYQQINPETGEKIGDLKKVDVLIREIPRKGFAITYLSTIINMIETIGNKKMQVVKYILQNMDSNNKLSETVREIAKGCDCSPQTVQDTLTLLQKCGVVARKTGTVMLSPRLVHKGNAARERFLMTKFVALKEKNFSEIADAPVISNSKIIEENK